MYKIDFTSRYSDNESYDKHGRWARIAYYKNLQIGWINRNRHTTDNSVDIYIVKTNFPVHSHNDTPFGIETFFTFEEAKKYIQSQWSIFINAISV